MWLVIAILVLSGIHSPVRAEETPSFPAPLTQEEKIEAVEALSEDELRKVTLEQADMLERLAQTHALGDDPEDEDNAQLLAQELREKAEKPGFKKFVLKNLKRGGKGVLLGFGYTGYSVYELMMTPIAAIVGFFRGLVKGEDARHFMTSPNEAFFGPRMFMHSKATEFGTPLLLYGEGFALGAGSNPAGAIAAVGVISAQYVYRRCVTGLDPDKPWRIKKDRFCKNTAWIDKVTVRAVGGASMWLGTGIHKGVTVTFKKLFGKDAEARAQTEEEELTIEVPPIQLPPQKLP